MVLEHVVDLIYSTVKYSWYVSALGVKFILLTYVLRLWSRDDLSLENFLDTVEDQGKVTLTAVVCLGFFFSLYQPEIDLYLESTVQVIAFLYYAFLFWRY